MCPTREAPALACSRLTRPSGLGRSLEVPTEGGQEDLAELSHLRLQGKHLSARLAFAETVLLFKLHLFIFEEAHVQRSEDKLERVALFFVSVSFWD